jgi:DNA-binding HxlR family transcriptional regulator
MSDRRSYHEYCGLAKALDVVGERWTLLVVRNLLLGPLRYSDLVRGLPGITTNLLAKRLREMEAAGLIERVGGAAAGGARAYRLTPLGAGLEPAIHALGAWGWHRMATPDADDHRSIEWLLVALRRRYRGGVRLRAELVADGVPFRLLLADAAAEIARGETPRPELRIRGEGTAIAALFLGGWDRATLPADLQIDGTLYALRLLVDAFEPAARAA